LGAAPAIAFLLDRWAGGDRLILDEIGAGGDRERPGGQLLFAGGSALIRRAGQARALGLGAAPR